MSYNRNFSLLHFLRDKPKYINKCQEPRCKTCPIIQIGSHIKLPNRPFLKPNHTMNCKSNHVIYCLTCTGCNFIYIGKTRIPLRQRITLHRQHTNNPNYAILKANRHFHDCNKHFLVTPLFMAHNSTESMLLFIETYFIKLLKPELNVDD